MKTILFLFISLTFLNASVNYSYTRIYDSFSCPDGFTYSYNGYADGNWYAPADTYTSDFSDRGNNGSNFEIYCTLTSQGSTTNKFFCTQYYYSCVPQICTDGAPTLTVTNTNANGQTTIYNHCDRNCADVGFEIGTDGKCSDPQICTDAANSCSDTCGGEVQSFSCTNGQVTSPCVCKDKCEDYANQCTQQCESQGMFVDTFECNYDGITSTVTSCQCGYWDNSNDNNSTNTDNTQNDDTNDNNSSVTENDEDITDEDTTTNNDNTDTSTNNDSSSNDTSNTNNSSSPDGGTSSNGNSLNDDLNNLGSAVRENTDAVKENTSILDDISETLKSIGEFLSDLTDLIDDPSKIGENINEYLESATGKYNEKFVNDQCQPIQTISINYHGREVVFLSQNLIDNYFPIDLMRKFIIFLFAFSGVMTFFRGSN